MPESFASPTAQLMMQQAEMELTAFLQAAQQMMTADVVPHAAELWMAALQTIEFPEPDAVPANKTGRHRHPSFREVTHLAAAHLASEWRALSTASVGMPRAVETAARLVDASPSATW